ncbi:hypothetical protein [Schlesneria paludicola]|uniref:hypothetical protein n=1 Tax=Schlesneria paludicola TaxID=360056 RepID=UPI00029A8AB3|nr:hypothetical protein [Schlesneria paludicola]
MKTRGKEIRLRHTGLMKATGFFLLSFALVGCGFGTSKPSELHNLAPVVGRITFKGQPTTGAELILFDMGVDGDPTSGTPVTKATVGGDGKFSVQTIVSKGTANGAKPGEYVAAISWKKPLRPNDQESDLGPELLPKKYQDPGTSTVLISVKPGRNELEPIELNP